MPRLAFTVTPVRSSHTIRQFRELLAKKMFQGIEIFYPYMLDEEGQYQYIEDIKYITKGLDIEIVLHLPHGKDNDLVMTKNSMLKFFNAIDFGYIFGVKKYTLHLGTKGRSDYLEKTIRNLNKLCDYAAHYDACIMIENMPSENEVGASLEELEYLFKNVDKKNLKFIYDTGHGHVFLKDTLKEKEMLEKLKPYLSHIHVSDNDSTRDAHAKIGEGNIEFSEIFSSISDYMGLYCLEILFNDYLDLKEYREDLLKYFK